MSTPESVSREDERETRQSQFSNALMEFCASDQGAITPPTIVQMLRSRPSKYICSPIMAIELTADLFIKHPRLTDSLGFLIAQVCLLYSKNPDAQRAAAETWKLCTRYAPATKSWAKRKMVELDLDEKDTKRVILEKHKDMIEYQSKCTATLNLLRDNVDNPELEVVSIEAATRVLQLLLAHSSQAVATAVDRAADGKIARTVGWAAATTLSVGLVVASIAFLPLATPAAIEGACCVVSGGLMGYTSTEALASGVDVVVTNRRCRDACEAHEDIAQNVKAYCLFLAYLYHKKASLGHRNDEKFISRVEEMNERLRGNVIEWHEPAYVQNYIESMGKEMDADFTRLTKALRKLSA